MSKSRRSPEQSTSSSGTNWESSSGGSTWGSASGGSSWATEPSMGNAAMQNQIGAGGSLHQENDLLSLAMGVGAGGSASAQPDWVGGVGSIGTHSEAEGLQPSRLFGPLTSPFGLDTIADTVRSGVDAAKEHFSPDNLARPRLFDPIVGWPSKNPW